MSNNIIRKSITIFEDTALTLLKPFSDEYASQLFVVHEDAYSEAVGILMPVDEIRLKFNGTNQEFNEILAQL